MHPRASKVRGIVSALVVIALATAGSAEAATKHKPAPKPKPVCDLVKTAAGGVTDQSLDITSADVATNATMLTSVVRVAKLTTGADSASPAGRQWTLAFTIDGHLVSVNVYDGPFGTMASYPGTVTLDTVKNEIRFSTKLSDLANASATPQIRNGKSVLTSFQASSNETVEGPNAAPVLRGGTLFGLQQADSASSGAKYIAGTPSCVTVGS